jgi:hypothetical protein
VSRKYLHISPQQWGWVGGVFAIAYAVFEIPRDGADRFGLQLILTRIVVWWSAFTALTGALSGFLALLLLTFWFGPRKQSLAPCPSPLTAGKRAVKRGIDDAVRGLERLKRAKHSGLNPACFDEKLTLFETHCALLNSYFCNNVEGIELQDEVRFAKRNREHEKEERL